MNEQKATKADARRLKAYRRGKAIQVKWLQEYRRRGWIGGGELRYCPTGGCATAPYRLTEAGLAVIAGGGG